MANVIIASTDAELLAILGAELSALGHCVIEAVNGQEAYESAVGQQADLVFVDASLPVFSGLETCALLRDDPELSPRLPVLLLSDDPLDSRMVEHARLTGVFAKKHAMHEVADLLARHLGAKARG